MTSSKFAGIRPKKKCCRSKPRCKRCPVVLHEVRKAGLSGLRGKDLGEGVQAHTIVLTTSTNIGVP